MMTESINRKRLSEEEFLKLHDELVEKSLIYTNNLILEGVEATSWTLTNGSRVSFKQSKRAFKKLTKQENR